MDKLTRKLYIILIFRLTSHISLIQCRELNVWDEFWSVSCQFKGIVPRTRRSLDQLNLEDPKELFNFLYPLADSHTEEIDETTNNQKRSSSDPPHSISNWFDDIIGLWESECHHRNNNNRPKRDTNKTNEKAPLRRPHNFQSRQAGDADADADVIEDEPSQSTTPGSGSISTSSTEKFADKKETRQRPGPTPKPVFFTQYGGDIEYFFPVLSFGIPFDGEMTFLGFHGFKGIFPYRRRR